MGDDIMPPDGEEGFKALDRRARQMFAYFNQGETWFPNGKPAVAISGMDPAWRHNAAAFLVRNARAYLLQYDFGEFFSIQGVTAPVAREALDQGLEEAQAERSADPEAWIKSTPLYKALVAELPEGPERDALARAARHWSDCPLRSGEHGTCTCPERKAVSS